MSNQLTYNQMCKIAEAIIASGTLNDRDGNRPRVEQVIPAVMYAQETFGSPHAVTLLAFQNNKGRLSYSPSGDAFAALFFQTGGRVAVDFDEKNVSVHVTAEHPRLLKPVSIGIDLDEALRRGLITQALYRAIKSHKPSNDRSVKYSPWFKNPMRMLFLQVIRELARMIGLGGGVYAVWRAVQGPAEIAEEIIRTVTGVDAQQPVEREVPLAEDDEGDTGGEGNADANSESANHAHATKTVQNAITPGIDGWPPAENSEAAGDVMKWIAAMKKMQTVVANLRDQGNKIAGEKNIGGLRTYIFGKMKEAARRYAIATQGSDSNVTSDDINKYLRQIAEWFELVTGETSLREAPDNVVLSLFHLMKKMEEGDGAVLDMYYWLHDRNAAAEQAQQMLDDLLQKKGE